MKIEAVFSPEGASAAQSGPGLSLHPAPNAVETTASPTPVPLAGVTTPDTAREVTVEVEPLPPVPSTSLQFVADWKELSGQEGRMLAYFQVCVCACFAYTYLCRCVWCVCLCVHVLACACVHVSVVHGLCTLVCMACVHVCLCVHIHVIAAAIVIHSSVSLLLFTSSPSTPPLSHTLAATSCSLLPHSLAAVIGDRCLPNRIEAIERPLYSV